MEPREQVIAAPAAPASVDVDPDSPYADALVEAVYDAEPIRRSIKAEPTGRPRGAPPPGGPTRIRVELTVRPFTDPETGLPRWAMLLSADECRLTDYPTRTEAEQAYHALVAACLRDDPQAWTETDTRPAKRPRRPAPPAHREGDS